MTLEKAAETGAHTSAAIVALSPHRAERSGASLPAGLALALGCGLLALSAGTATGARADESSLGAVGYGVVPLSHATVRMVEEQVTILVAGEQAHVEGLFVFENGGAESDVLMGFPQARASTPGSAPELIDLRTFVDGEEVPTVFLNQAYPVGDLDFDGWYTFQVRFLPGQRRTVRHTYHGRLTLNSDGSRRLEFVLRSGATWQGGVGRALIELRWENPRDVQWGSVVAVPRTARPVQSGLSWSFWQLEPTREDDIAVTFRPLYGPHNGGRAEASSGDVWDWDQEGEARFLFADEDESTSWYSSTGGQRVWLCWCQTAPIRDAAPTLGLALLPAAPGEHWRAHGRPRQVSVQVIFATGGEPLIWPPTRACVPFAGSRPGLEVRTFSWTLRDAPQWQRLSLFDSRPAVAFRIEVESTYPGEAYNDVGIAEIHFPQSNGEVPGAGLDATRVALWAGLGMLLATGGALAFVHATNPHPRSALLDI